MLRVLRYQGLEHPRYRAGAEILTPAVIKEKHAADIKQGSCIVDPWIKAA